MKNIISAVLSISLLLATITSCFADKYLDCSLGANGTGTIGSPYNGTVTITSLSASEDLYVAQGATCTGAAGVYGADSSFVILNWSGTAADPVYIKTYDAGHGTTPPIFDSRETLSSWSQLGTSNIYYATTTVDDADALSVDDVGLQETIWKGTATISQANPGVVTLNSHGMANNDPISFMTSGSLPTPLAVGTRYYVRNQAANTFEVSLTSGGASIQTTSAGSGTHYVVRGRTSTGDQLMVASSFTQDNAGDKVYVWTADGSTPADNAVKISRTDNYFRNAWASQLAYIYFDDLIYFKGASRTSVELGGWGADYFFCRNCRITQGDVTISGVRGFSINGPDSVMKDVTCSYASLAAGVDNACFTLSNFSRGNFGPLTVTNTLGTCFELNGVDTFDAYGHDLTGTNCGHGGLEVYGCYGTSCGGAGYNLVERVTIDNTTRVTGVYGDSFSSGIGVGNNGFNNTIRNSKIINVNYNPLSIRSGSPAAYQGHHNYFQNITVYNNVSELSGSSAAALSFGNATDEAAIQGQNVFENIIVYLAAGGRVIYDKGGKNILRNNVYYTVGGSTQPFTWANTSYADLAAYTAVNTSDDSDWADPLINTTTLVPAANSPAIGKGRTASGVNYDFNGKVRSAVNDAGAIQTSDDSSTVAMGGATIQ